MALVVFNNLPGSLTIIEGKMRPVKLVFDLEDWNSIELSAVITAASISRQTSHQLSVTLGGGIYLYVFGDAPGEFSIECIAANENCAGRGEDKIGFDKVLAYYEENKLSDRPTPMRVIIGSTPLTVLLRAIRATYQGEFDIWQFGMSFVEIPASTELLAAGEEEKEEDDDAKKGGRVAVADKREGRPVPAVSFVPGDVGGDVPGGVALIPSSDALSGFDFGAGAPEDLLWS